jgi:hypothetical protein
MSVTGFRINPGKASVNVEAVGPNAPTLYFNQDATQAAPSPLTTSSPVALYLSGPASFLLSLKIDGAEHATGGGQPLPVTIASGTGYEFTPSYSSDALSAPLTLPASPGQPLTTQGGNTLDDGNGNIDIAGTATFKASLRLDWSLPAGSVPVSGTVYQNTSGTNLLMSIPVTGTVAGTAQVSLGPTSSPTAFGDPETILLSSVKNETFTVPSGWYWSLTASGLTLGTASQLSF